MKFSNRRRWTKSEKWLLFAPLLVGVFAGAMNYAPKIFGKMRGNPDFVLKTAPGVTLTSIALSRDGASLVATGFGATIPQNGDIWIWNARNLQLRARWPGGPRNPNGGWASRMPSQMAWSLDGKRLMFGRMSEPFQSVDVASRRVLWSWGRASYEDEIRLSPDGRLLFLPAPARGNNEESAYALLDAATGKVRCRWSVRGFPGDPMVSFAPDGKTLASIGPRRGATKESWYVDGRDIEIRRVSDGHLLQTIASQWTRAVEFSPDCTRLLAFGESEQNPGAGITGSRVVCFSLASKTPLWTYGRVGGDFPQQAIWSPDGKSVAVAAGTNSVLLLDSDTGAIKTTLRDPKSAPQRPSSLSSLIFSPDGKRLFARGKDAVLVWDLN